FECSEQLEASLEKVKKFDYSQFSDVRSIGSGKFAIVFSATFEDRKYALKSLHSNLQIDVRMIGRIKRERPSMDEIKITLERLSTETSINFISNNIDNDVHFEINSYSTNNSS
ncbi:12618_t:CDS:2, partial [Racocetra persica]